MALVTGIIKKNMDLSEDQMLSKDTMDDKEEVLSSRDIYKELRLRGYHYKGLFRSIKSSSIDGSRGHITWHGDWMIFLDNIFQMKILMEDTRDLFIPTYVAEISINTKLHYNHIGDIEKPGDLSFSFAHASCTDNIEPSFTDLAVFNHTLYDTLTSGGVTIRGLQGGAISRRKPVGNPVIEIHKFVPFIDETEMCLSNIVKLVINICLENSLGINVKVLELIEEVDHVDYEDLLSPSISESFIDIPLKRANINVVCKQNSFASERLPINVCMVNSITANADSHAILAIGHRLLSMDRESNLTLLLSNLYQTGFILTRENAGDPMNIEKIAENKGFSVIIVKKYGKEKLVLLRKKVTLPKNILVLQVHNQKFEWINKLKGILREARECCAGSARILIVGENDFENGMLGFLNCLRQEPGGEYVRGILIQDEKAPKFSLQNDLYSRQLKKDMVINVLRANEVWGTYSHVPLIAEEMKPLKYALVQQLVRGDLRSLSWVEGPIQTICENKNLVRIHYASLNFKYTLFMFQLIQSRNN